MARFHVDSLVDKTNPRRVEDALKELSRGEAVASGVRNYCSYELFTGGSGAHYVAFLGLETLMAMLLECGIACDRRDSKGRTPLSLAAEQGRVEVSRLLLQQQSVDVNSRDHMGRSPLMYAAKRDLAGVIRLLLAQGRIEADPSTHILFALDTRYPEVVELLLERHDIDPNAKSSLNWTTLAKAAKEGHTSVAELL